jgi:arylsulfatase A-like enzyme
MKCLYFFVALLIGIQFSFAQAAESQPNIVFIIADDLGWADVAFHGGNAPTPNLDRLLGSSLELTQHYVAPVCSPTRAGLLTGRYWSRFWVNSPTNTRALPWDTITLPRALQSAGYETCLIGKWHLGSLPECGPNHFGFDHSYGSLAGGIGPWNHRYKQGPYSVTWHRNETLLEDPGHVTDLLTREAVEWISKRDEKPFFLYVPFTAVHLPIKEPQEWLARVPNSIPDGVAREYAACTMHLDAAVGEIVAALDKSGKRENTLLVFTSDNGGSTAENNHTRYPNDVYPAGDLPGNNTPFRGGKGQLYEGGIRVPTFVNWPGKLKSGRCDEPLHITDWMPTFCELAGYQPESNLKWDGNNIWPTLAHGSSLPARALYWVGSNAHASAVRHGDWKLISFSNQDKLGERVELYNLAKDPHEKDNLAESETDTVAQLQDLMHSIAQSDRDAEVVE